MVTSAEQDNVEFDPRIDPSTLDPDLQSAADITLNEHTFMLYGQAGSGKTTMIGTFPRPILYFNLSSEQSVKTLRGDPTVHYWSINSYDQIMSKIAVAEKWITEGRFPYRTVAVDSLSFLVDAFLREKRNARGDKLIQADWGIVANHIMDVIERINSWPGCHKVWTAGVDTEKDELTGDIEGYPKMFNTLKRSVWNVMDIVLYMEATKDPKTGRPIWYAHGARHRYFSARIRGAPVPGKFEPTFDKVMEIMERTLYGWAPEEQLIAAPAEEPLVSDDAVEDRA